jgi:hypothetical protein
MKRLAAGLLTMAFLTSAPAHAGKPSKDKGKGRSKDQEARVVITFTTSQRDNARAYFVEKHGRGGCPPGLAKKGNGCLPPGKARKRYAVGSSLPRGVATEPLPAELSVRVGPPPSGYTYVLLDGDLLQLAVGSLLVADAIGGLVE